MAKKLICAWPFPKFPLDPNLRWHAYTFMVLSAVNSISKLWLQKFNSAKIVNGSTLYNLVEKREKELSLITVANHHSCIDDPLMWGILKWETICSPTAMRFILGAHDICFTNVIHNRIFALGKTVPIIRGNGVYQKGMDFVIESLNEGGWVHSFPEGKVNTDKKWIRFKWGVGRLVAECSKVPVVLPICHIGMDDILPNYKPYIPRVGKTVTIVVGEPIYFKASLDKWKSMGYTSEEIRKAVTDKIQQEFDKLYKKAERAHFYEKAVK